MRRVCKNMQELITGFRKTSKLLDFMLDDVFTGLLKKALLYQT